jgi:hypothetical protein
VKEKSFIMNRRKKTFQYEEDHCKSEEGLWLEKEKLDIKVESRGQ